MSPHEFAATINTFNTAAWRYSPPAPYGTTVYYAIFICLTTITFISAMTVVHRTHQMEFIFIVPFSLLVLSMFIMYYRQRQRQKFESVITHLCSCMNAIENVRGINFRLTYLTPEQQNLTKRSFSYAITIEFDDRYNLLHHFFNNTTPSSILPSYSTCISISPPLHDVADSDLTKPSNAYYPTEKSIQ
ncbi:MAG: hypothetical protein EXX96DRAFT_537599 [Benjaminiella poitrasii]|nr:MAG: hypothetical protein EXX96DRAFT_537599 [Benjaminiella poitrasii]